MSEADDHRALDIGPGSLARTLTHTLISEWCYVQRMTVREVPPYVGWPIKDETPPAFDTLEKTWAAQAEETRDSLEGITDWDKVIEYRVARDDGRREIVRASLADFFTQLALHEIHHRAQAMIMLRKLGAPVEGDIDFNAVMFDRRPDTE